MPDAPVARRRRARPQALRTDLTWYGTNRAGPDDVARVDGLHERRLRRDEEAGRAVRLGQHDQQERLRRRDHVLPDRERQGPPAAEPGLEADERLHDRRRRGRAHRRVRHDGRGRPAAADEHEHGVRDEILSMYIDNKTTARRRRRRGVHRHNRAPDRADVRVDRAARWPATRTPRSQAMATAAITPQLAAAEDTTQTIGGRTGLNGWLRIYDQTKDLIAVTKSHGYDVWIITASPQDVIEAFAPMVGIAADHVIGIRSKTDANSKLTYKFEGCGTVADDNAVADLVHPGQALLGQQGRVRRHDGDGDAEAPRRPAPGVRAPATRIPTSSSCATRRTGSSSIATRRS